MTGKHNRFEGMIMERPRFPVRGRDLVAAVFDQLPPEGSSFPAQRRGLLLAALAAVLDLIYDNDAAPPGRRELGLDYWRRR